MLFTTPLPEPDPLRAALRAAIRMDKARCVAERLAEAVNCRNSSAINQAVIFWASWRGE